MKYVALNQLLVDHPFLIGNSRYEIQVALDESDFHEKLDDVFKRTSKTSLNDIKIYNGDLYDSIVKMQLDREETYIKSLDRFKYDLEKISDEVGTQLSRERKPSMIIEKDVALAQCAYLEQNNYKAALKSVDEAVLTAIESICKTASLNERARSAPESSQTAKVAAQALLVDQASRVFGIGPSQSVFPASRSAEDLKRSAELMVGCAMQQAKITDNPVIRAEIEATVRGFAKTDQDRMSFEAGKFFRDRLERSLQADVEILRSYGAKVKDVDLGRPPSVTKERGTQNAVVAKDLNSDLVTETTWHYRSAKGLYVNKETGEADFQETEKGYRFRKGKSSIEAIRSAVDILAARGAKEITIKSKNPDLASNAWLAATQAGLTVQGYVPTEKDTQALDAVLRLNEKEKLDPVVEKAERKAISR